MPSSMENIKIWYFIGVVFIINVAVVPVCIPLDQ